MLLLRFDSQANCDVNVVFDMYLLFETKSKAARGDVGPFSIVYFELIE